MEFIEDKLFRFSFSWILPVLPTYVPRRVQIVRYTPRDYNFTVIFDKEENY